MNNDQWMYSLIDVSPLGDKNNIYSKIPDNFHGIITIG
jgi:hypothetical protein